jgi:ABC-type protease/lipase transport system fused ATPase/permease subunit
VFQCDNYNFVLFFYRVKNKLKILHIFINVYDLHYILLYVIINFFIHSYIFLLAVKKHVNNTYTLIHLR